MLQSRNLIFKTEMIKQVESETPCVWPQNHFPYISLQ